MTVAERVRAIVAEQLGLKPEKVAIGAALFDDLGADELERIEIVMGCEVAFGFLATDEDIERMRTVADLIGLCAEAGTPKP